MSKNRSLLINQMERAGYRLIAHPVNHSVFVSKKGRCVIVPDVIRDDRKFNALYQQAFTPKP